jgi:hypothetical protein
MKKTANIFSKRLLGAAILSAALITPAIASAQDFAPAGGQDQQIQGPVNSIDGTWNITVADANGYADNVALHQGTIINPTGLTLEPGMSVTIDGYADGPNFDAMEIDTPYQYSGPAPVAVYYGPGSWYPGYAAGWGPSFSLVFNAGSRSWQQRPFAFGGQVRRPVAPPQGWQDRPHGYIGNNGNPGPSHRVAFAPQQRQFSAPQGQQQRQFAAPPVQQQRQFAAPPVQQQRQFAAPPVQQQRQFAAPPVQQQRQFAAPPVQQQRQFAAPPVQQQRQFAAPPVQQQRSFAAPPQRTFAAPPAQQRSFAAPQRQFSAPAQRSAAPAGRAPQEQRHR